MDSGLRSELLARSCKQNEPGESALPDTEVQRLLGAVPEWGLRNGALVREYDFRSYKAGVRWFNEVAQVADAERHHPDALVVWRKVTLTIFTHSIGGLSINDFILAAKLDKAFAELS